jgi:predicted dehydrogenase
VSAKLRFGIVGTGTIAHHHAAAVAALPNESELAACCDVDLDRARGFAARWRVPSAYGCARTMLDSGRVDVVCVCTPHPQHAEPLLLAAERGVHGISEKPLTATVADADRVIEAYDRRGALLTVIVQRRWFPAALRVRRAIDEGFLGHRVILGESYCELWRDETSYRRAPWRGRWETEGGGVLLNQSPHNIDFLLWYMGPAQEVFGYWANLNHGYIEVEDNAVAVIKFRSGGLAVLKGTTSMKPPRREHGVTLLGEAGPTVSVDVWGFARGSNDVWTIPGDEGRVARWRREDDAFGTGDLPNFHAHQIRDTIRAIRSGCPPPVTGSEGRRVVALIQGIYESGRQGKPVRLGD